MENKTENLAALTRPLDISEIEFRVGAVFKSGWATLLAYKTARTDMSRLNEAFGVMGWEREHKEINGNLFCGITAHAQGRTITKWDAGDDVATSGVKGLASDSFKRAGFNFGIGVELYAMPLMLVQLLDHEFYPDPRNASKAKATNKLRPNDWKWSMARDEEGNLLALTAVDPKNNNKLRYEWRGN